MFPALYAILDASLTSEPLLSLADKFADAGVTLIQLRAKHLTARSLYEESRRLVEHLAGRNVRLIINDRPDIAALTGAGGVHLGQDDLPVEDARGICGKGCWVGVSTHNLDQFKQAIRTSADYIAVGPMFSTASKLNPDPVVGLELIRAVRPLTQKPLVAIGGINVQSAEQVWRAGADSVAVISDLMAAPDPGQRAREYLEIAARIRAARN